ncbi:Pkinase domain-containing protein [Cephalotus follicularis]|uniref:mitogen-activated protein kinase kinase kinase n=1 Tax=Cephalotus follicularis TaxID=3775 RepID=A0A1Q3B536_CEPFO|nr:Pkinase domain-containing protein [Cephalotus follicularis]
MQDLFGSVRRSLVFRTPQENQENNPPPSTSPSPSTLPSPMSTILVDKINSCLQKSQAFAKPSPNPLPPIRWRKGELIGSGAFGRVYMGMNLDSGELLAVKQVLIVENSASREKQQAHIREFEEEVKLLKNLSHPNIVRYLGTVREEETLNILLEFVPGGSISSLLGKFGPFPEAVIRTYTKQLLLGLEYLHSNGIMHRDIKGANILVDNKGCIKLADFGASKQVVELATVSGAKSMKGTPYWMAPEVIRQTGHSFSADIWSVGCTVIEMATGKPPWSEQYKEVAALFYVGSTKSHPEIPEHLSIEAQKFLLQSLQREPNMRPAASELLQHPFLTGKRGEFHPAIYTSVMHQENSGILSPVHATNLEKPHLSTCSGSIAICNLGTLSSSAVHSDKLSESKHLWGLNTSDDDMCQIDRDDLMVGDGLTPDGFNKSFDPKCELSNDWMCKVDECLKSEPMGIQLDTNQLGRTQSLSEVNKSYSCGTSQSEDDDELTESKIRAFLDEKALELKKLQTPLFEEFYNSMNAAFSPSFSRSTRDNSPQNYLKLPPKSRSPARFPAGSPSEAIDAMSTASPGSNSSQTLQDNSSPQCIDQKGPSVDAQPELTSPCMSFSERQRKWKEELDQELERKREMMRQAGVGGKTSSPNDRALNWQRERTRFASPGK